MTFLSLQISKNILFIPLITLAIGSFAGKTKLNFYSESLDEIKLTKIFQDTSQFRPAA